MKYLLQGVRCVSLLCIDDLLLSSYDADVPQWLSLEL